MKRQPETQTKRQAKSYAVRLYIIRVGKGAWIFHLKMGMREG